MDVSGGPQRGTRDNGLRCGGYVALADLDPRVADAMLGTLREQGIAAYVAPTPGSTGGYMERRLPSRPLDRLWVDDQQVARARAIVDEENAPTDPPPSVGLDDAWQQVLASLQSPAGAGSWPAREDITGETAPANLTDPDLLDSRLTGIGLDPADPAEPPDEHFVPPPAPPLPKLSSATVAALGSIVGGLLLLIIRPEGGSLNLLGIAAVLVGAGALVWRMRQGPPTDSGWDDGAVL